MNVRPSQQSLVAPSATTHPARNSIVCLLTPPSQQLEGNSGDALLKKCKNRIGDLEDQERRDARARSKFWPKDKSNDETDKQAAAQTPIAETPTTDKTKETILSPRRPIDRYYNNLIYMGELDAKKTLDSFHDALDEMAVNERQVAPADNKDQSLQSLDTTNSKKTIRWVSRYLRHVKSTSSENSNAHDIYIVLSEGLAFLISKLLRNPDRNKLPTAVAKEISNLPMSNAPSFKALVHNISDTSQSNPKALSPASDGSTLIKNLKDQIENINDLAKKDIDQLTKSEAYLLAARAIILSTKPDADPFSSVDERINTHSHGLDNYHLNHVRADGLAWEADTNKANNIMQGTAMPIPHITFTVNEDGCHSLPCGIEGSYLHGAGYYEDTDVSHTEFHSTDKMLADAYNALCKQCQQLLTPAFTGIEVKVEPHTHDTLPAAPHTSQMGETREEKLDKIKEVVSDIAEAYALAKIKIGVSDILLIFGELTGNKPQVPQKMIGHDGPEQFVKDVAAFQLAIFKGAKEGIQRALTAAKSDPALNPCELNTDQIKTQIRIVFHNDASVKTGQVAENNAPGQTNYKHPTINDLLQYCKLVDDELAADNKKTPTPNIECTLQIAHLLGTTPANHNEDRTKALFDFFNSARKELKHLRVFTDTSWLTASARTANLSMGRFLQKSTNTKIKEIGKQIIEADHIANEAFMLLSAGERHFAQILNKLNTPDGILIKNEKKAQEAIAGMAMMRAGIEKATQSYYQQLGLIFNQVSDTDTAQKLFDHIAKNQSSPDNFIGMMIALRDSHDKKSIQDAVPFVWGTDDLTQHSERSGIEKNKLYRDQFICSILMGMLINKMPDGEDKDKLRNILRQILMGADRDQKFWFPEAKSDEKMEIDPVVLEQDPKIKNSAGNKTSEEIQKNKIPIEAANKFVELGSRKPKGITASYETVNPAQTAPVNAAITKATTSRHTVAEPDFIPGKNVFYWALERWAKAGEKSENRAEAMKRIDDAWWHDYRTNNTLDLSGLNLSSIPNCIISVQNIGTLNLAGNNLQTLDLSKFTNLHTLRISHTEWETLKKQGTNLPQGVSLEYIDQPNAAPSTVPPPIQGANQRLRIRNEIKPALPSSVASKAPLNKMTKVPSKVTTSKEMGNQTDAIDDNIQKISDQQEQIKELTLQLEKTTAREVLAQQNLILQLQLQENLVAYKTQLMETQQKLDSTNKIISSTEAKLQLVEEVRNELDHENAQLKIEVAKLKNDIEKSKTANNQPKEEKLRVFSDGTDLMFHPFS